MLQKKIRGIEALFIVREWMEVHGVVVTQKKWDRLVFVLCLDTNKSVKRVLKMHTHKDATKRIKETK